MPRLTCEVESSRPAATQALTRLSQLLCQLDVVTKEVCAMRNDVSRVNTSGAHLHLYAYFVSPRRFIKQRKPHVNPLQTL